VNVYADHNFLIYCIKHPHWGDAVTEAHRSGKASLVLSPWHFYEYGNARGHADTEDLIQFVEALQPQWTMERADLLMRYSDLAPFAGLIWPHLWGKPVILIRGFGPGSEDGLSTRRSKVELYEQIRREYEHGAGTIRAVARKWGVHRREVRRALASAMPAARAEEATTCAAEAGPGDTFH
jgi:hypothetical protein